MNKSELKKLIKEAIKEMQYPKPGLQHPDEPEGPDNPYLTSDEKIVKRLQAKREYINFLKKFKEIMNEPKMIADLEASRKDYYGSPLER
jgi:hypothetical protein